MLESDRQQEFIKVISASESGPFLFKGALPGRYEISILDESGAPIGPSTAFAISSPTIKLSAPSSAPENTSFSVSVSDFAPANMSGHAALVVVPSHYPDSEIANQVYNLGMCSNSVLAFDAGKHGKYEVRLRAPIAVARDRGEWRVVARQGITVTPVAVIPRIVSVNPSSGQAGSRVAVQVEGIDSLVDATVTFTTPAGAKQGKIISAQYGMISALAPAGLYGQSRITVNSNGKSTRGVDFFFPNHLDFSFAQSPPLMAQREDFAGLLNLGRSQLLLAAIEVAASERIPGATDGPYDFGSSVQPDRCYAAAMEAVGGSTVRIFISQAFSELIRGVLNAAIPAGVSTDHWLKDLAYKLARDSLIGAFVGDSKDQLLMDAGVALAEEFGGYILAQSMNDFLAGAIASGTTAVLEDAIRDQLQSESLLAWTFAADTRVTAKEKNSPLPGAKINGKMFYNPHNHYVTIVVAAKCGQDASAPPRVYAIAYKVERTGSQYFPGAKPLISAPQNTLKRRRLLP